MNYINPIDNQCSALGHNHIFNDKQYIHVQTTKNELRIKRETRENSRYLKMTSVKTVLILFPLLQLCSSSLVG